MNEAAGMYARMFTADRLSSPVDAAVSNPQGADIIRPPVCPFLCFSHNSLPKPEHSNRLRSRSFPQSRIMG